MAKRRKSPDDLDSPWKDALHIWLPFAAFFFLDIEGDIDWSRGYEALDKEFQQIVRTAVAMGSIPSFARSSRGQRSRCASHFLQVLVDELDRHRPLADGRGDALD